MQGVMGGEPMKMTVAVRKDLGLSPGKVASQVAHAVLQLSTTSNVGY